MGIKYAELAPNVVRRSDRAVGDEGWIESMLRTVPVGTLGTVAGERPFLNTNLFVYEAETASIYLHTARKGRTRSNVEAGEGQKVCFSVFGMGRLLPAEVALEFSVEYAGVVVFGDMGVVTDEAEGLRVLQLIMDKYAPHLVAGEDYRRPVAEELKRTTVLQLKIESWSGKRKVVADDFAGAYAYDGVVPMFDWRAEVGQKS
ncbi:MAG TPA: pyridoxamine 5'-phosphate oxidase family protein [Anaerolineae bacterium]|nr:pyridoxamine 5'-phosphate oxidase family protein [Anaerolineae bacterium]